MSTSTNKTTGKIAQQINKLNSDAAVGNGTARIQLDTAIDNLEQEVQALSAQLVPGNRIPIYISPQSDQSRLDYTTWNEFDPTGPYGAYDDNYCRPTPSGGRIQGSNATSVYPVRNASSGRVTLEPCSELLGPEVQQITNIKDVLDRLALIAKHRLLTEEAGSANSMKQTRETAENKIAEYERATRQYMKLAEMIDGFQEVSQRHQMIINNHGDDVDAKSNKIAVQQDDLETYLDEQHAVRKRNEQLLGWVRIPLFMLWIVALALFLLKQI